MRRAADPPANPVTTPFAAVELVLPEERGRGPVGHGDDPGIPDLLGSIG